MLKNSNALTTFCMPLLLLKQYDEGKCILADTKMPKQNSTAFASLPVLLFLCGCV
jgi:hypothetical protein